MSVLILSWDDHNRNPYSNWLDEFQGDIFLICTEEGYETFPSKKFKEIIPLKKWSKDLIKQEAKVLHTKYNFDKIIALDELDLEIAAELREELDLAGHRPDETIYFRNKILMKKLAFKNSIKIPLFSYCKSKREIDDFLKTVDFPIVVKPVSGIGSVDTHIIKNSQQLELWYINKENDLDYYIFEEFIEGEMYHIDGLVLDKKLKFCWPSKYLEDGINQVKNSYFGTYLLPSSNCLTEKLEEYTAQILEIFPLPENTTFHLEVFIKNNKEIIFCEIACRSCGGRYENHLYEVFGININEALVKKIIMQVGINDIIRPSITKLNLVYGFILLGPPIGVIDSVPIIKEDELLKFSFFGEINKKYSGSKFSSDGIAYAIFKANNENDISKKLLDFKEKFYPLLLGRAGVNVPSGTR